MKRVNTVLIAVLLAVTCTLATGQRKDGGFVAHLISCVDSNFDKVHSGEVAFTIRREPTDEGQRTLPKAAQQLREKGLQGADSLLLKDLVIEETKGRFVFSGHRFRIEARQQRDERLVESVASASKETSSQETSVLVSFDGTRFAYLSGARRGVVTNEVETSLSDLRVPHVLSVPENPARPAWERWSETLRRAYQDGRLRLVRVEGQAPKRTYVVKILRHSPQSGALPPLYELVHFKEEWGCMPAKIETYDTVPYQGRMVTWKKSESRVDSVVRIGTAGWFPSSITEVTWGGEIGAPVTSPLVPVAQTRVTIELSKPNARYPDKLFAPNFPPGTFVFDRLSNTYYVVKTPLLNAPTSIGALLIVVLLVVFVAWRLHSLKKKEGG